MTRKWKIILIVSIIGNISIFYVAYKALGYRAHINFFLDKYLNVVNEISQRQVHEADNLALRSDTTVNDRIVFFGSQIISRWNLDEYFTHFETINRGVDSQRVAGFLLRFKPDVIDLKPEYVFIEISSYNFRDNHTIAEIEDYVSTMAELAEFHNIKPILATIIPIRRENKLEGDYEIKDSIGVYNTWLKEYAGQNNYLLADINTILGDRDGNLRVDLSYDAIDLNESGYRVISESLKQILEK